MLAIGRAMMSKPRLLLLDEPSLGLAPLIVRDIFRVIAGLRAGGVACLLVEQNARAALQVADYAYVMESGSFVLQGGARELARKSQSDRKLSWAAQSCLGFDLGDQADAR